MKPVVLAFLAFLFVTFDATPAHAIAACNHNDGVSPKNGTVLPPRARIVAYVDHDGEVPYVAKLNGKVVPIKVTKLVSAPYRMRLIEIDTKKTGTLVISRMYGKNERELANYIVRSAVKLPDEVVGSTRHFTKDLMHSKGVVERYDALSIDIGETTPAVMATVKIRRDAHATWSTLEMPVVFDKLDKRTSFRIGELGCAQNYSANLLEQGVDIEASVMLVDGSTRVVKLPSRVSL